MSFLNQYFRCETEDRPVTAEDLRDKYINQGALPSFVYMYCDDSLSLTETEVDVLRDYIDKGGFLFMDSPPDADVQARVAATVDRIIPGARLTPVPTRNPINSFLFKLPTPGVGLNFVDGHNYEVKSSAGDRIGIFYTPGNFCSLYSSNNPQVNGYVQAQYQMGANVIAYAINKGDTSGVEQRPGANATATVDALKQMGIFGANPGEGTDTQPKVAQGTRDGQFDPADGDKGTGRR